ncbi:hypothetical protein BD309DRAFT_961188 [Dichomitus squalens]|nr:hypothetical protein BD309DRAFT_961188 [Dichomitus squalens]
MPSQLVYHPSSTGADAKRVGIRSMSVRLPRATRLANSRRIGPMMAHTLHPNASEGGARQGGRRKKATPR